jgi:hypothetical protein
MAAAPLSYADRQALVDLASSPTTQLRQFSAKLAARALTRRYEVAHAAAEVSHADWLAADVRQALDELVAHLVEGNPLQYIDYEVDFTEDDFLCDSDLELACGVLEWRVSA